VIGPEVGHQIHSMNSGMEQGLVAGDIAGLAVIPEKLDAIGHVQP